MLARRGRRARRGADGKPDGEGEISLEEANIRALAMGLPGQAPPVLASDGAKALRKTGMVVLLAK